MEPVVPDGASQRQAPLERQLEGPDGWCCGQALSGRAGEVWNSWVTIIGSLPL